MRRLRWRGAILCFAAAAALLAATLTWLAAVPVPNQLDDSKWVQARLNLPVWVPLSDLPPLLVDSVILHEDDRFYDHGGVDWPALFRAAEYNLSSGDYRRGASTLTQQLAKNVFLEKEKTLSRKAKEWVLAARIERRMSKAQILEAWFNVAEFYPGVRGIDAGCRRWFQTPPSRLTAKQAVFLSVILPNPKRGFASKESGGETAWMSRSLQRGLYVMHRRGRLDEQSLQRAVESPLWDPQKP